MPLLGEYCTSSFEANNRLTHGKMELTQDKAVGEIAESCLGLLTSVNEKSKNFRQLSSVGVKSGERRSWEVGWFSFNATTKNQSPWMKKRLNRRQWLCPCCKGRNHYSTGTLHKVLVLNFIGSFILRDPSLERHVTQARANNPTQGLLIGFCCI